MTRGPSILFLCIALLTAACERDPIVADVPDTIPPIPPAGLIVEKAQDGYITISWHRNNERDISGYIVFRSELGTPESYSAIDTTSEDYYIDESVSYDIRYFYLVKAIDESGNVSSPSATVNAVSPNANPPRTPVNVTVFSLPVDGFRIMRLTWTPKDDSDLRGYNIYRSLNPDVEADATSFLAFTPNIYFDDSSATSIGSHYYYRIRAVDNGLLESEPTSVHSEIHLPAAQLATPGDWTTVTGLPVFEWEPVPGAAEYEVQVFETPDDVLTITIIRTGQSDTLLRTPYEGPYLQSGRIYYWRVVTFSVLRGYPNSRSETRAFIIQP